MLIALFAPLSKHILSMVSNDVRYAQGIEGNFRKKRESSKGINLPKIVSQMEAH